MRVPVELVEETKKLGRLTVVNFAAGGIATPADAAMMMQLGCDGVFVGSGIFKSEHPAKMAKAIVDATMNFNKPEIIAKVSEDLGSAMDSLTIESLDVKLAERGW
jgi:pyridoxal 5'-phosphate synthase pdxS subunit